MQKIRADQKTDADEQKIAKALFFLWPATASLLLSLFLE